MCWIWRSSLQMQHICRRVLRREPAAAPSGIWHGNCSVSPAFTPETQGVAPDKPKPRTRSGDRALALLLVGGLLLGATLLHGALARTDARARVGATQELARELRLTDLALFTEARYTRHPALADRFTPFQNHPMALEHFPSGVLVRPPPHLHE
jgi:hypothetical protein